MLVTQVTVGCTLGVPTRLATDQVCLTNYYISTLYISVLYTVHNSNPIECGCQVKIYHEPAKCGSPTPTVNREPEGDQEEGGRLQGPLDGHPGEEQEVEDHSRDQDNHNHNNHNNHNNNNNNNNNYQHHNDKYNHNHQCTSC